MESKKILVILSDTPLGKTYVDHVLRSVLGMSAGYKEHKVNILFTSDSVLFALMPTDQGQTAKMVKALKLLDASLYLDKKSLDERNIEQDLIEEPFRSVDRDSIMDLLRQSQLTISM